MDAVRQRDPELVRRAHADIAQDPTVRGTTRRATEGALDAVVARLPSREWIEQTLADFPRRWFGGLDPAAEFDRRTRALGRDALAAVERMLDRRFETLGGRLEALDRRLGAIDSDLARAVSETAAAALAGMGGAAHEIAVAATRGVWEESRRQIEIDKAALMKFPLADDQRIGVAIALGAAAVALILGLAIWVRRLTAGLRRAEELLLRLSAEKPRPG